MRKILFIDACLRGKESSRTYKICKVFLDELIKKYRDLELIHIDLQKNPRNPLNLETLEKRNALLEKNQLEDAMFYDARCFAEADLILIGAPYWDLSYPAILKAYIEQICVTGIAFKYTETGEVGLCQAKDLVYVTTAGGYIGEQCYGSNYIEGIAAFTGIKKTHTIKAEGLDIIGNNVVEILKMAEMEVKKLIKMI